MIMRGHATFIFISRVYKLAQFKKILFKKNNDIFQQVWIFLEVNLVAPSKNFKTLRSSLCPWIYFENNNKVRLFCS